MKLLKPSWVNHSENSIFSIDVHPDGSRFATGGQGQDSGKIIIWNMGPVIDKTKEVDEIPKILCQMDHHIACVNVVRWSNNGLFLASGSDDKLVMIWQYVQGGMAYQNIENWKCGFTLRGHSGDVLDLAWSSKDQYLATCSVDNTVIIWNALKFPEIINRIEAHAGLVKGVAWDPVGVYFASQSDDKTLKIWRTLDWSLEKSIEEPFKQCAGTTHVLRLNWSPDGQLVISAHAINNGAPTAQSIDRGNKWSTKLDFVGHRKAVTAVRFFPKILKPIEAKTSNTTDCKTHCLFALGSRDRSISIWLTNYSRPLCVIQDLFDNPIMDLSWSKNPKPGLLACSMDGTVSYTEFEYAEIGLPLSKSETEEFFMKKYNHDVNAAVCLKPNSINQIASNHTAGTKKDNPIKFIENLDILMAQEEKQKQQEHHLFQSNLLNNENSNTQFHNSNSLTNTPSKMQILTENQKQIERRMPDGRRRITPICICKPGEYDTPKPFGSEDNFNKVGFEKSIGFGSPNDVKIVSKTATEQSTIIVEKRDEKNEILEISPVKSVVYSKSANLNNSSSNEVIFNPALNDIIPIAVVNKPLASVQSTVPAVATSPAVSTITVKQPTEHLVASVSSQDKFKSQEPSIKPSVMPSKPPIQTTPSIPNKTNIPAKAPGSAKTPFQTPTTTSNTLSKQKQPVKLPEENLINKPQQSSQQIQQQLQPRVATTPNKASHDHSVNSPHHHMNHFSQQFLTPLKIDKKFTTKIISDKTLNRSAISLEIHNSISLTDLPSANLTLSSANHNESDYNLNLVKYLIDHKLKWQIYFLKRICDVTCSSHLLACVCIDSTIHLFKTSNGTQICCPIVLDSRAAVLKCNTNYCMCLTVNGFIYVWKYENNNSMDKNMEKKFPNNAHLSSSSSTSDFNCLKTVINRQSCQSILKDGVFSNALLTDHGIPVIYMSKNRSFFYSPQTECWHLVPSIGNLIGEDSQLLFNASSLFSDHTKSMKSNGMDDSMNAVIGPLSIIQSKDKSINLIKTIELMNKSSINENPLFNQTDFTLTHLESQVNASVGLNSSKEYKFWLMTYARYLSENEYEDKLNDLCSFLCGPLYSSNWNENVMNFKKRDLLKEILSSIVAQNLKFQRLHSYYKHQLNLVINMNSTKNNNILNRLIAPKMNEVVLNEESKSFQRNTQNSTMTKIAPTTLTPTTIAAQSHLNKNIQAQSDRFPDTNESIGMEVVETQVEESKNDEQPTTFQHNENDPDKNETIEQAIKETNDQKPNDSTDELPTTISEMLMNIQ